MDDIFVGQLMTADVETIEPHASVQDAAETLVEKNIGSLVVVDEDDRLEGILTSTDYVLMVADGKPSEETVVGDYMTDAVVSVLAEDEIQDAADRIVTFDIHHLPVVDEDEKVIGMVSTTDLAEYLSEIKKPSP
jgi:CBS domain-containing protein